MARVLVLVLLAGCFAQTTGLVRGAPGEIEGGTLAAEALVSKYRFGAEWSYERVDAGGEDRGVTGWDYVIRFGFVAKMLEDRCASQPGTLLEIRERSCAVDPWWFDFGVAGGFGPAYADAKDDLIGHAWVGAWLDVRLWPSRHHPVLRIEAQRDAYTGEYAGGGQIAIGLGWITEVDGKVR